MNRTLKAVLLIVGLILIFYGIYILVKPEASVRLGNSKIEVQENTMSIITIGLGIVSVVLSMLVSKRI